MLIDGGDRWIEEGENTQSQEEAGPPPSTRSLQTHTHTHTHTSPTPTAPESSPFRSQSQRWKWLCVCARTGRVFKCSAFAHNDGLLPFCSDKRGWQRYSKEGRGGITMLPCSSLIKKITERTVHTGIFLCHLITITYLSIL